MSSALTESSAGLSSAGSAAAVVAAGVGVVAAVLFDGAVVVHAPADQSRAASAKAAKRRLFIVRVASLLEEKCVLPNVTPRAAAKSNARRGGTAGPGGPRPTRRTSSNRTAGTRRYNRPRRSYNRGRRA